MKSFMHIERHLDIMSRLLLQEKAITALCREGDFQGAIRMADVGGLATASCEELADFLELADTHHVIVRALAVFRQIMEAARNPHAADWAAGAIEEEKTRIARSLPVLETVCRVLESEGCSVKVIKSLDHLPDLGSDLDLFTDAGASRLIEVMRRRFDAQIAPRSVGDRLANKWNFLLPGLSEPVEVHVGRLGQTGEQVAIGRQLVKRGALVHVDNLTFPVPAPQDRVIISTLQRMYRHFYLRLCDIVDTTRLLESGAVSFDSLRESARVGGIWRGTATYLVVVSDYVKRYRGTGLRLPEFVTSEAEFGGEELNVRGLYVRIPIAPGSLRLYAAELGSLVRKGEWRNAARLSTLPCLATSAYVEYKITGDDKGIW